MVSRECQSVNWCIKYSELKDLPAKIFLNPIWGCQIKFHCVVGAKDNKGSLVLWCRRGLLAYVYNGVSLTMNVLNALVAGNGSYIVRPCGHDLHGPTSPFLRLF